MKHRLIGARFGIQIFLGGLVFLALTLFALPLPWVLGLGLLVSILAGKFFCRWACPVGLLMEFLLGRGGDAAQGLYMYHKLGCPIAWAGGLLNRLSLFRITRNDSSCSSCGACDRVCYIPSFDRGASIFKPDSGRPMEAYACSRCLKCVEACPTGSLALRFTPLRRRR